MGKNEYLINIIINIKKVSYGWLDGWNMELYGKCVRDYGGCLFGI